MSVFRPVSAECPGLGHHLIRVHNPTVSEHVPTNAKSCACCGAEVRRNARGYAHVRNRAGGLQLVIQRFPMCGGCRDRARTDHRGVVLELRARVASCPEKTEHEAPSADDTAITDPDGLLRLLEAACPAKKAS